MYLTATDSQAIEQRVRVLERAIGVDVVIENGLQPYDIQALIPIIEAAGGRVTDWSGGPCDRGGDVLACGDPSLHKSLVSRLSA